MHYAYVEYDDVMMHVRACNTIIMNENANSQAASGQTSNINMYICNC